MATALPQWQRLGSCEPTLCDSACCRFFALEVNPLYLSDPDLADWVRLHGVDLTAVGGRVLARIPLGCTALASDGSCHLYGQPARPTLCSEFPRSPLELYGVEDVCTFAFTRSDTPGPGGSRLD